MMRTAIVIAALLAAMCPCPAQFQVNTAFASLSSESMRVVDETGSSWPLELDVRDGILKVHVASQAVFGTAYLMASPGEPVPDNSCAPSPGACSPMLINFDTTSYVQAWSAPTPAQPWSMEVSRFLPVPPVFPLTFTAQAMIVATHPDPGRPYVALSGACRVTIHPPHGAR